MKKIFPINHQQNAWFNYSNYLNWMYDKIQGWEDYLKYFSPCYQILNESMTSFEIISKDDSHTIPVKVIEPAWEYTITDGTTSEIVYCYFPSELEYRQGYLNTHPKSYLCFFAPPDAYEEPINNSFENNTIIWNRRVTITKDDWTELLNKGANNQGVIEFPISRLVMSNKWRHTGFQHRGNSDAFDPKNYIIIAKPSAAWYVPTSGYKSLSFEIKKNAAESVGSIVPFILEFEPVRYILNSQKSEWPNNFKTVTIHAADWAETSSSNKWFIYTLDSNSSPRAWNGSYPIMHKLVIESSNSYEDFITDDLFSTEIRNIDNYATAIYNISTPHTNNETGENSIWNAVSIIIC